MFTLTISGRPTSLKRKRQAKDFDWIATFSATFRKANGAGTPIKCREFKGWISYELVPQE
jgi:hypothetical protein